ncbi:MAG: cold shock domain-containing protein [Candidatus Hydrogenedentes bacterium]|nr:cold shock domain-containing protein [Candidatus Hydrogenedentota bacterium]
MSSLNGANGNGSLLGRVKWFNDQKGFGFITRDNSPDVFVHHSAIKMEGFRTLREGEEVQFELLESPKGLQAVNVSRPQ